MCGETNEELGTRWDSEAQSSGTRPLDGLFYSPRQSHCRVTRASLEPEPSGTPEKAFPPLSILDRFRIGTS